MNREEMKNEAIKRLEIMKAQGLMNCVLRSFKKKDTELYMSENNGLCGALYYFNDLGGAKQEWIDLVNQFEEKYNCLVYHITHEYTSFGELLDLFFVSDCKEDWGDDMYDLYNKQSYAYVYNLSVPEYSEFGTIAYRVSGGGLIRVS